MRPIVLFTVIALAAATSCSRESGAPRTRSTASITGTVVERLDSPPYSFVRLDTGDATTWVAVPLTAAAKGSRLTVANGATVKGFEAPAIGRRFDAVVFGVVERK